MVGLIILAVVCGAFAVVGYFANTSFQEEGGYLYLGGINGGRANKYLKSNQKLKNIHNELKSHGKTKWNDEDINKLFRLGSGAVLTSKDSNDIIVVANKTIIVYGDTGSSSAGADGQVFFGEKGIELFETLLERNSVNEVIGSYQTTIPAKKKSVVGSAVAGAVIAGGAGAVVGAIASANHNTNSKDTIKTHYIHNDNVVLYYYTFSYHLARNSFEIDKMYTPKKIKTPSKELIKEIFYKN